MVRGQSSLLMGPCCGAEIQMVPNLRGAEIQMVQIVVELSPAGPSGRLTGALVSTQQSRRVNPQLDRGTDWA